MIDKAPERLFDIGRYTGTSQYCCGNHPTLQLRALNDPQLMGEPSAFALEILLERRRDYGCSDPRDLFYSLLEIATDEVSATIRLNYSKTCRGRVRRNCNHDDAALVDTGNFVPG
jgi:hypothetical protein